MRCRCWQQQEQAQAEAEAEAETETETETETWGGGRAASGCEGIEVRLLPCVLCAALGRSEWVGASVGVPSA